MRQQALAPITSGNSADASPCAAGTGMRASLHWVRERERQRISLVGPLGGDRSAPDAGCPAAPSCAIPKKMSRRAPTARQLLVETTGWDVPFDDMNVVGARLRPAPGAKAEQELDEDGRPQNTHAVRLGGGVSGVRPLRRVRTSEQAVRPPPRERARHRTQPRDDPKCALSSAGCCRASNMPATDPIKWCHSV